MAISQHVWIPQSWGNNCSGTITGLRISPINGYAFIDNLSISSLTPRPFSLESLCDGTHEITIYDSSGLIIRGFGKSQGAGETLGSEIVTNGGFADTSSWSANGATLAAVAGGETGTCLQITQSGADNGLAWQTITIPALSLIKLVSAYHKNGTVAGEWRLGTSAMGNEYFRTTNQSNADWTNLAGQYKTLSAANPTLTLGTWGNAGSTTLWDTVSIKQQTAPSAYGFTITNSRLGETQDFSYKTPSFTYNETSYRVVIRKLRIGGVWI